jgi:hypothetical protein
MMFKTALLFGLLAGCYAAPVKVPAPGAEVFERRGLKTIPTTVDCGGTRISMEQIKAARTEGRTRATKERYPARFGNKDGKNWVFNDEPTILSVSPYSLQDLD